MTSKKKKFLIIAILIGYIIGVSIFSLYILNLGEASADMSFMEITFTWLVMTWALCLISSIYVVPVVIFVLVAYYFQIKPRMEIKKKKREELANENKEKV